MSIKPRIAAAAIGIGVFALTGGLMANAANGAPQSAAQDTAATSSPAPYPSVDPSNPVETTPPTGSLSAGKPVTLTDVGPLVKGLTAEYANVTQTYGLATTLGSLATQFPTPASYPATTPVLVVTNVGTFTPEFGNGKTFAWGAEVIDPTNGVVIGSFATPNAIPSFLTAQGVLPAK